mmetsp:Transcript_23474/g.54764  ORF Transcript_23474/g.54764 Transcript_23474/m.54764 type:complete len:208 (+) Transcript_23474:2181-2804(+)
MKLPSAWPSESAAITALLSSSLLLLCTNSLKASARQNPSSRADTLRTAVPKGAFAAAVTPCASASMKASCRGGSSHAAVAARSFSSKRCKQSDRALAISACDHFSALRSSACAKASAMASIELLKLASSNSDRSDSNCAKRCSAKEQICHGSPASAVTSRRRASAKASLTRWMSTDWRQLSKATCKEASADKRSRARPNSGQPVAPS